MRASLVPVDEIDSDSVLFPLRPLFPNIQTGHGTGGGPPGIIGDILMSYEDTGNMGYETAEWFNTAWQQRIPLSINVGQVPSPQTDFPLLINDTYTNLIGAVEAELRFTGADHVQLKYEIQKFDNGTGELIAWMKKPTVDDNDIIYIYFDSSGALDEQDKNAVWNANYTSVNHLDGDVLDSTINAQDFTDFATTSEVAQIGNGRGFNGTVNQYLIRNPYAGFPVDELTCELWIKTTENGDGMVSYAVGAASLANHFILLMQANLQIHFFSEGDITGSGFNDGNLHHVMVTFKSSNAEGKFYLDGLLVSTHIYVLNIGSVFTDNGALVLGQEQDSLGGGFVGAQSFDGILDEFRMSNIVRDADYNTTAFNNQNDQDTFYFTATVQSIFEILDLMAYES